MKTIKRKIDSARYFKYMLILSALGFGLISCGSDSFKQSENGYQYKFVRQSEGMKPQDGAYLEYNMRYTNEKDSTLYDSGENPYPVVVPFNSQQWEESGPFYKALLTLAEGDSIILKIPTKRLFNESFNSEVPGDLNEDGEITMYVGFTRMMTEGEFRDVIAARESDQMAVDIAEIERFLAASGIAAQSTESGLHYVITKPGSGENASPGSTVSVHYEGSLLDGTVFDSSIDRGEPLSFPLGMGQVIPGWDEGIALLNKGAKATLYIPSGLAYGPMGAGSVIAPNSILKFEVELVDFE